MAPSEIIEELFFEGRLIPTSVQHGKRYVRLTERDAPDSSVEVRDLPDDAIVIDVDANFNNENLFRRGTNRGVCKRSDYLILSAVAECAIFLEMKRTSANEREIIQQLVGGSCMFDYCCSIVRNYFNDDCLASFSRRFVALLDTVAAKRPTRFSSEPLHDTPNRLLKIRGTKVLYFNHLAKLNA
jgi:hypothetical protein